MTALQVVLMLRFTVHLRFVINRRLNRARAKLRVLNLCEFPEADPAVELIHLAARDEEVTIGVEI